jgi:hypothetical protein
VAVRLAEMSVVHAEAGKNLKNAMDEKTNDPEIKYS